MISSVLQVIARRLRLVRINRNFLVYLLFLVVSVGFWFMQSVKEQTEVALTFRLRINNLPDNIVYTSDMPEEISVNYVAKGGDAFYYKFMKNEVRELAINYKDMVKKDGKLTIETNVLRRAVLRKSPKEMTVHSIVPNRIEVFYSNGQHKRVPIIFDGHVSTTGGRYLCGINMTPDSADVYAPSNLYDDVLNVKTENVDFEDLEDTLVTRIALVPPRGVKVVPDSIGAEICIDIFTDKTVKVPIYSENVPNNKLLRTFPLKADVTFLVSATHYENITADDFLLVVDYKDAVANAKRCKLYVRQQPDHIRHLRIAPESVEYVIEQTTE